MTHPELAAEQAYVDRAYDQLDRMRSTVARTQEAMATEWAALNMEAWAKRRMRTFEDAERGLVFGRLTLDGTPRPLYVGRRWVHDDEHKSLVVNWQAPAARPFYTATPQTPHGVQQRRRFRAEGRRLTDISDESLDGSAVEGASVSDFLLEELERRRDVRMRDIVATIQSDQYRLITAEPEGALVVQGGPGTGKTAVGLHRASWLLYTHREQLRRVLVVGPNPTFMDYVSHVLPTLGEEAVEQRAVTELVDGIEVERDEEPDVARLKGDPRLREVVARAVEIAVVPAPEELVRAVDGIYVRVRERDVAELLEEALEAGDPLGLARERFRMAVLRRFYERYGELLGPQAFRSFDELERALRRGGFLTRWLDRVLPLPQPEEARLAAPHLAGRARGRVRGRARRRRAEAPAARPAASHVRPALERPGRAAARRGAGAARRRAALVRARDRRRGAGSLADAAARDLAPRGRRLAHDPRRRRAGDRPRRLPPLAGAPAVSAGRRRRWRSRSCATPTASRPRSWTSRCRCSTGSRPRSSRRSPTARAATRRGSCRSARTSCSRPRCARRPRSPSWTGCSR